MNIHVAYLQKKHNDITNAATQAMGLMEKYGISPTPQNYTLWFEYSCASIPNLNQRLNDLIDSDEAFTEELCKALYIEFFKQDHMSASLSSSDAIVKMAAQVQSEVEQIGDNISDYGNLLKLAVDDLENDTSVSAVKDLTNHLIQSSQKAQEESVASAAALKSMSQEIERLTDELREASQVANTDPLTGLANRRFFDTTYEELHAQAQQGKALSCILVDIDHFKNINDTYGHPVGDLVIRFIANLLRRAVGDAGVVARYGGEEFVVLLSEKTPAFAESLAESIRKAICRQELKSKEHNIELGQITASFGVGTYNPGDTMEALINRTDGNLYQAKESGRNRVVAS